MKVISASISDKQYRDLKSLAEKEHRTVSNLVSLFLRRGVNTFDASSLLSEGVNTSPAPATAKRAGRAA